jgi:predicted RNA binding protein YcfA (HicA-like mRNA interferase family)
MFAIKNAETPLGRSVTFRGVWQIDLGTDNALVICLGGLKGRFGQPRPIEAFGFRLARISGSHHIFEHPDLPELVNMQKRKGKAKPYQVRQFLRLVEQHNLQLREDG